MKKIMKKVILSLFMVAVMLSSTACTTTAEKFEALNQYAIYFAELVNEFSIHSKSEMIASSCKEDSIFVEYGNGDALNISLSYHDTHAIELIVNYTSETCLSVDELCKIIYDITYDEITDYEKKLLENFVEKQTVTEFKFDDADFRLEMNEQTFILEYVL